MTLTSVSTGRADRTVWWLVGYFLLLIPVLLRPEYAFISAQATLFLIAGDKNSRILLWAPWLGANLTWLGAVGPVSYLGRWLINPETLMTAVLFSAAFSLGIYICAGGRQLSKSFGVRTFPQFHSAVLTLGVMLFVWRFASGIPLLAGNNARLEGVASVPPLLGLMSGALAIAGAFLVSERSVVIIALQILLFVVVFGTASRLLLLVVAVGFVTSNFSALQEKWSIRNGLTNGLLSILSVWGLTKIYDLRTSDSIRSIEHAKTSRVEGFAQVLNDWLGSSLFLSARNGLAVADIIRSRELSPPRGFILGGLWNSIGLGTAGGDPERWLTTAIGLSIRSVGATATPVWSGAWADFGMVGMVAVGLLFGCAIKLLSLSFPGITVWLAIAVVLSYYGSYLVSAQFVATTLILLLIGIASPRQSDDRRGH